MTSVEATGRCTVTMVEQHGGDYSIVDAARISYGRRSEEFEEGQNARLIRRLIESGHVSTMFIPGIVVRMQMPIFIMREFVRHRIGVEFNELSRRYRSSEEEPLTFFAPSEWRVRHVSDKQRGGETLDMVRANEATWILLRHYYHAEQTMKALEERGIAREQARLPMPVGAMTEIYARLSFAAVCRIWQLRVDPAAQQEIRDMILQFDGIMRDVFPIAWTIWREIHDSGHS